MEIIIYFQMADIDELFGVFDDSATSAPVPVILPPEPKVKSESTDDDNVTNILKRHNVDRDTHEDEAKRVKTTVAEELRLVLGESLRNIFSASISFDFGKTYSLHFVSSLFEGLCSAVGI